MDFKKTVSRPVQGLYAHITEIEIADIQVQSISQTVCDFILLWHSAELGIIFLASSLFSQCVRPVILMKLLRELVKN